MTLFALSAGLPVNLLLPDARYHAGLGRSRDDPIKVYLDIQLTPLQFDDDQNSLPRNLKLSQ
jgi:hypothetical protein